ncbi:MAG TPA: ABC transporter ATP-binding protein [Candidatus Scatomonas merdavium]|nr:ABC transporter ATP-binding protein [Candidatus Scatomonas merdavium]
MEKTAEELLEYCSVDVAYDGKRVLQDISFSLRPGEILGIAGESGSGKSTLIRAALGLLGRGGLVARGDIWFRGKDLPDLKEKEMRGIRGAQIAMIFQDAGASLCPIRTIGDQIHESLAAHERVTREESGRRALEMFSRLGFRDGKRILESYPFEMSGGMNQRIGIALAMLQKPAVLLADEPTSALDVSVQRQVVEEMLLMRKLYGTAMILVTHNIGVIRAMADTVLVLKDGKMVEYGSAERVLCHPEQEYTKELLAAVPTIRRN